MLLVNLLSANTLLMQTTVTGMIRMVINTVLGLFYINQGSCLWQCRSLDGSYEVLFLVCCLLHSFLRREAAFLFPNMNAEVRLSAPVFFEITDGPAKRSWRPQIVCVCF